MTGYNSDAREDRARWWEGRELPHPLSMRLSQRPRVLPTPGALGTSSFRAVEAA